MNQDVVFTIIIILFILFSILLGRVEEKDMREINDAYFSMNMWNPIDVMEYLTLCTTKPLWRVSLIVSIFWSLFVTGLYVYSKDIPPWFFFALLLAISYITMSGYLSYYSFHVLTPNGSQENWNKYRNAGNVHVKPKFSG